MPPPSAWWLCAGLVISLVGLVLKAESTDADQTECDGSGYFATAGVRFLGRCVVSRGWFFVSTVFVFINATISRVIRERFGTWQTNVVNDCKATRSQLGVGDAEAQALIQGFYLFIQLNTALSTMFLLGNFWWLIAQIVANNAVVHYTTALFLRRKI